MTETSMKAVIFNGPHNITVETRPIPELQAATDIIVKVNYAALCGSDLHVFRGHEESPTGYIMGHEFTGVVSQVGNQVKSVKPGDQIVSPFTTSCLDCFYCDNGLSSRCSNGSVFGTAGLDGGQAAYVRVPFADGTVFKAPPEINEKALLLMADVFPTGFFAVSNAFKNLNPNQVQNSVAVVIGCGPVGLSAVIAVVEKSVKHVIAVDSVPARLELAKGLGAEPWNYVTDREGLTQRILELTDGRGADVVIEVVGVSAALEMGFEILRPFGTISSVGVHNGSIPWSGSQAYGKNLCIYMGRCPVRSIFPEALALLQKKQDSLDFMFEKIMPLSSAVEGYKIFEQKKVTKVVFEAQN